MSTVASDGSQRCQTATVQLSAMPVAWGEGPQRRHQRRPVQCRQPEKLRGHASRGIPDAGSPSSLRARASRGQSKCLHGSTAPDLLTIWRAA